jgi:hypothetical protein
MRPLLTVVVGAAVLAAAVPSAVAGGVDPLPDPDSWGPTEVPPSPSPSGGSQAQPWKRYQTAFALNLGIGSAVGSLGLTCSFLASSLLSTEIGVGIGISGAQFSAMQKVLLGWGRTRFVAGAGLSYGSGNHDFPFESLWLNLDLAGVEFRTWRGLVLSLAAGATMGLVGGDYIDPIQNDCGRTYCGNSVGKLLPQYRMGVGFWF